MQALCRNYESSHRVAPGRALYTQEFNAGYLRRFRQQVRMAFRVTLGGKMMTFDSFECAIHAMAPQFAHRECRLLGYGVVTCPDSSDHG